MNAPAWLPAILAAAMIAILAFLVWRMAVSRLVDGTADYESDAFYALAALAMGGMLVTWMHTLPRDVWAAVFAFAAVWFAARLVLARRRPVSTPAEAEAEVEIGAGTGFGRLPAAAVTAGVLVYMLLAGVAPTTLSGSTAGQVTMAGMADMIKDVTIDYPAVGLVFVVAAVGYVVVLLDRLSLAGHGTSSTIGIDAAPTDDPVDDLEPVVSGPLVPRAAEWCRIVLLVTMAYAMLATMV
ncbi:MAG TPA: DUF5134 domain-containing protein [Actinocrinis sp.]|nr:DUF5134 domain-containing protein [Actinocrinis sp.]